MRGFVCIPQNDKKNRKKDEKCYFLNFDLLGLHTVNLSLYFCCISLFLSIYFLC